MATYFDIHPVDPQARLIDQVVTRLREGELLAYPTDSGYALGCVLGNRDGLDRIRRIRHLDDKHHFTLVCSDFAQLGQFVVISNSDFRLIKSLTPGPYTFILPATGEVPRRMLHAKKKTVGVRIPGTPLVNALLDALGEPLQSSTLIMPGEVDAMGTGWEVADRLEHLVDMVIDSAPDGVGVATDPTTVINLSEGEPRVDREGAGDVSRFEV